MSGWVNLSSSQLSSSPAEFPGGHRRGVTPVPIPNTEVKPSTADGTACVSAWESRSLPGLILRPDAKASGLFLSEGLRPSDSPSSHGPPPAWTRSAGRLHYRDGARDDRVGAGRVGNEGVVDGLSPGRLLRVRGPRSRTRTSLPRRSAKARRRDHFRRAASTASRAHRVNSTLLSSTSSGTP